MDTPAPIPSVSPAEGIARYSALGDELIVLQGGKQTAGKFMSAILITSPGGGPPPHVHDREDEWFVLIEGRIEFWLDGVWTEAKPGQCAYLPKGTPHTFRNIGDTPSRMVLHTAPAGFEDFYSELSDYCAAGEPEMAEVARICAEHGIHILPPGQP